MKMLRAVDLFAGAGGTTTGAEASGRVKVILAVNHWLTAINSHKANHPETRHICALIDHINPHFDKTIPDFDLLLASPECTGHSIARGDKPIDDQKRTTPWNVVQWADAKKPKWIVVENVREFVQWGPVDSKGQRIRSRKGEIFEAWVSALRAIGYRVEWKVLNSADYGEATKRLRLFVICRRGNRKIPWPEPTHSGKWRAAKDIINWDLPCPSIFGRKFPLREKTIGRIIYGLNKFAGRDNPAYMIHMRGTSKVADLNSPAPTITAGGRHLGLIQPFLFSMIGRAAGRSASIDEPIPTIVAARENHGVIVPFLINYHGGKDPKRDGTERAQSVTEPLGTVDTSNRYGLVQPFLIDVNHGDDGRNGRHSSIDEPLGTITTKRGKSLILPFITQYNGTGGTHSIDEPLTTITTNPRHGLVQVELYETMKKLGIADIGFRMFDTDELAAATGFPKGYILTGSKEDQVRQIGNAVPPGFMKAICTCLAEAN